MWYDRCLPSDVFRRSTSEGEARRRVLFDIVNVVATGATLCRAATQTGDRQNQATQTARRRNRATQTGRRQNQTTQTGHRQEIDFLRVQHASWRQSSTQCMALLIETSATLTRPLQDKATFTQPLQDKPTFTRPLQDKPTFTQP
jgi:hypothetical protein